MSQDVEMKAYEMVEEMFTEREKEEVTTTEIPCEGHNPTGPLPCFCHLDDEWSLMMIIDGECLCACEQAKYQSHCVLSRVAE